MSHNRRASKVIFLYIAGSVRHGVHVFCIGIMLFEGKGLHVHTVTEETWTITTNNSKPGYCHGQTWNKYFAVMSYSILCTIALPPRSWHVEKNILKRKYKTTSQVIRQGSPLLEDFMFFIVGKDELLFWDSWRFKCTVANGRCLLQSPGYSPRAHVGAMSYAAELWPSARWVAMGYHTLCSWVGKQLMERHAMSALVSVAFLGDKVSLLTALLSSSPFWCLSEGLSPTKSLCMPFLTSDRIEADSGGNPCFLCHFHCLYFPSFVLFFSPFSSHVCPFAQLVPY